jgi:hypothetical protein
VVTAIIAVLGVRFSSCGVDDCGQNALSWVEGQVVRGWLSDDEYIGALSDCHYPGLFATAKVRHASMRSVQTVEDLRKLFGYGT